MTTPHPLDAQEPRQRLILARTISLGMILVLAGATVGFGMVVFYALEGIPLMGNFIVVLGEPLLAVVAAVLAPFVLVGAVLFGSAKRRQAFEAIVTAHPETVTPDADAERLVAAFTAGRFVEYAVLWGYGLACAILFHLITAPLLAGLVVVALLAMVVRFPYSIMAKSWYDAGMKELQRRRAAALPAGRS